VAAGAEENGKGGKFDREVGHEKPEGSEGEGNQKGGCQPCGVMGRSAEGGFRGVVEGSGSPEGEKL